MIRGILASLLYRLLGDNNPVKRRGFGMVFSELERDRKASATLLDSNLLAAIFEGGTMGLFAIAVAIVVASV
jgi:hypothetical protein